MATVSPSTYRVSSGTSINAGRFPGGRLGGNDTLMNAALGGGLDGYYVPSWRTAMTTGTVALIPGNTLADIDPKNSATYNPNYPGGAPWAGTGGQAVIVGTWNGAVYDAASDVFHIPLAGGHTDYAGNEPYKVSIYGESANWAMLRAPSGAVGNTITLNDGQEATGLYSDGRLRAVHSYSNHCYVPGHGPIITCTTAHYSSASGYIKKCFVVSETTGEASVWADWTGISDTDRGGAEGAACYDSTRGCIWHLGSATSKMLKTLISDRTTTGVGAWDNNLNGGGSGGSIRYMPGLDLVAVLKSYTNTLKIFNPATGAWTTPTVSGSFPAGYMASDSAAGIDWDSDNGRLLLWNQSSNTNVITVLTPPGSGADTGVWTVSTITFTGVTVTVGKPSGAFGRFAYSPRLKGCVLLNAANQQLHFFATGSL